MAGVIHLIVKVVAVWCGGDANGESIFKNCHMVSWLSFSCGTDVT
jgi:hypothetical protein